MNGAATEAIGYKKSTKSEWLSKDTWNTIEERKQLKKNFLAAKSPRLKERAAALYREKDKEVKKSARKDKRIYTDKLAERAQRAAEMKDMKTVYQITKKLRGDHGPKQDLPVKAEDGSAITEEKAKLERWKEHFEKILNRSHSPITPDIREAETDLEIEMGPITLNEVNNAIHKLKNDKAPGEDGVYPEMLKADEKEILQRTLQDI